MKKIPSFKCRDIGMNCPFETAGKNEDEIMKKITEHAGKVHNMKTIDRGTMEKIKGAIKP